VPGAAGARGRRTTRFSGAGHAGTRRGSPADGERGRSGRPAPRWGGRGRRTPSPPPAPRQRARRAEPRASPEAVPGLFAPFVPFIVHNNYVPQECYFVVSNSAVESVRSPRFLSCSRATTARTTSGVGRQSSIVRSGGPVPGTWDGSRADPRIDRGPRGNAAGRHRVNLALGSRRCWLARHSLSERAINP
jgi:hypothetical protein